MKGCYMNAPQYLRRKYWGVALFVECAGVLCLLLFLGAGRGSVPAEYVAGIDLGLYVVEDAVVAVGYDGL